MNKQSKVLFLYLEKRLFKHLLFWIIGREKSIAFYTGGYYEENFCNNSDFIKYRHDVNWMW